MNIEHTEEDNKKGQTEKQTNDNKDEKHTREIKIIRRRTIK